MAGLVGCHNIALSSCNQACNKMLYGHVFDISGTRVGLWHLEPREQMRLLIAS